MLKRFQTETPQLDSSAVNQVARIAGTKSRVTAIQDRLVALSQDRVSAENDVEMLRREVRDWQTVLDKTLTSTP